MIFSLIITSGFGGSGGADTAGFCFLQSCMCYSFNLLFASAVCSIGFLLFTNVANFVIKEAAPQPLWLFI